MELVDRVERYHQEKDALYWELKEHPLDLDGLFNAVVRTIREDYPGFEAKYKYFMPGEYHTYVFSNYRYGTLTIEMLARSLHQFVGDLHDRHLRFHCDDWIDFKNRSMRYRVRAYEDSLYVTSAEPETGLKPGDRIVAVQSMTPARIRDYMRKTAFYSSVPERELWGGYLRMARSLEVVHADGRQERMEMELYPAREETYPIEFRKIDEKTAYLKLERMDRAAMDALLAQHGADLAGSQKLILDLRRCIGGEEDACWGLLPYLVDTPRQLSELLHDEGSYLLFSENNCDRRYSVLNACLQNLTDQDQRRLVEEEMALYRENYGKGLLYQPPMPLEDECLTPAERAPEQVVVLTDTFCEDEGEQFVAMCQRCGKKVTTLGRPTMGTLDYFDCITLQVHEHMTLSYPIRMTKAAYEGRGIAEKGLDVDEYHLWSPEEIHEDVLLKRALEL